MKTYHIKDLLKKDLLVLELARLEYYEVLKDGIYIKDHESGERGFIEGSYTLLGKPKEIREEDAKAIVEYFPEILGYQNFKDDDEYYKETATESLLSAIESVIFWDVNPLGGKYDVELIASRKSEISGKHLLSLWHEAELRTFDRNRSIILVKN